MDTTTLMSKVAEVAPQHYDFLIKTASEIKDSPFRDEIIEELDGLMKVAIAMPAAAPKAMMPAWAGAAGKAMLGGMGAIGGAAAAGIAYALAGDMYDAARRGITKSRNYQAMMDANPGLKRLPAKDVQRTFSVLHKLNPEFAAEPSIAGAWVQRSATYGEDALGDVSQLKSLVDSRKTLTDSKRLPQAPKLEGRNHGGVSRKDLDERFGAFHDDLGKTHRSLHGRFDQWDAAAGVNTKTP